MKFKKVINLALVLMLLTGCEAAEGLPEAGPSPAEVAPKASETIDYKSNMATINGKKIGTVNALVLSDVFITMFNVAAGASAKELQYYSSLKDGVKAVKDDKIAAFLVADFSAKYLEQTDEELALLKVKPIDTNISLVTKKGNNELLKSLNDAIKKLKQEKILDELLQKWVFEFDPKAERTDMSVPEIKDAPTLKVGISGDLPPLDFIDENGNPYGFNVAFMTEISKMLNKNIEFVNINADSRIRSLLSNDIDIFFWQTVPDNTLAVMVSKTSPDATGTDAYVTVSMDMVTKK